MAKDGEIKVRRIWDDALRYTDACPEAKEKRAEAKAKREEAAKVKAQEEAKERQ